MGLSKLNPMKCLSEPKVFRTVPKSKLGLPRVAMGLDKSLN